MTTPRRALVLTFAALSCAAVFAGCARQQGGGTTASSMQIKGSDTMVNLGQGWAESFMKANPDIQVAVTGGGSGTGIAALINKTTDIAMASRAMKPEEVAQAKKNSGVEPSEIEVAHDAVVVVVNPANPVKKLTIKQLADIYTGKIANWKDLGGKDLAISVLSRDKNSGTHVFFLEHVLRGGKAKGPEEYGRTVLMLPSSQAIADEVAGNPASIGYFGLGYLDKKRQQSISVAKDPAAPYVEPTPENALSGKYPISRPLFLYTNGKPAGNVDTFVKYVLSADGQKLVEKEGFVPLKGLK